MHPAKSVIFFRTASGAGYGLLIWLSLFAAAGRLPADPGFTLTTFALAFVLVIAGLLSSTFHLGHPERAWRALSQWRTSWLSREGVAAIFTFAPAGLFALLWLMGEQGSLTTVLAVVTAVSCMLTVYCTAMIYASLESIPAWNTNWTAPGYHAMALATGALLIDLMVRLWELPGGGATSMVAALFLLIALGVKLIYWVKIRQPGESTAGTATGLGDLGIVTLLEAPHEGQNYLLREMGFRIARKHAGKLRRIAILLGFVLPLALSTANVWQGGGMLLISILAVGSAAVGIVTERWLFFAEAKHKVTLYYGEAAV